MGKFFHHPFFIRLFNWEYWPFNAVYVWTMPAWFYFCVRSRSLFFFTASNPCIENGGLIGESKKDIHQILPKNRFPATVHFTAGRPGTEVLASLEEQGLSLPLVGKPDIGGRGRGVKILRTPQDIIYYAEKATMDFHIQAYIDYPLEVGIFYYRYPNKEKGMLTGIVSKQFLTVKGNGRDSLLTLIRNDKRGIMYLSSLQNMHRENLDRIPSRDEEVMLSEFGNHARGSKFLDRSSWIDDELTDTIDRLSKEIDGFYFGRFDVRYNSLDELKKGEKFMIIELNGAGSEPTHMYDPEHSVFFAVKEIIRHWNIMARISKMNHDRGVPYPSFSEGRKIFRKDKEASKLLDVMAADLM
jgi:hypothetical protein